MHRTGFPNDPAGSPGAPDAAWSDRRPGATKDHHMTLERARELLKVQAEFGGFYNANSSKLILSEVMREHGQEAVDRLILELELERVFGFRPGTLFQDGLALDPGKS
jgi:hypothetical protein